MKRLVIVCAALGLLGPAAWAGVVVEMEVQAIDEPGDAGGQTFYAQGEMTRADFISAGGEGNSVIFREQTMYFLDHDKKACQKIDKEAVDQMSEQLEAMMKQMENIPPEQRAMMEKMMKGKMPGMQKPPTWRVETGGSEQVGEYQCTVHTLYADEEKAREVCSADESVGDEIAEAMEAFHALARFTEGLMKVAKNMPFAEMIQMPYQGADEIGGFPIRTRVFDGDGEVVHESTLKSVTRREFEADVFAIPKGYKVKNLGDEMRKGR